MSTIIRSFVIVSILLASMAGGAAESRYVLPGPEDDEGASPPCLNGEIVAVSKDLVVLKGKDDSTPGKEIKASITKETMIYTVYGGHIDQSELQAGQKVHVWFHGESCAKPQLPLEAARIEIASRNPADDWP